MKKFNIKITEPQIKSLKILKEKTGLKMGEHIRRAIDEYLKNKEAAK